MARSRSYRPPSITSTRPRTMAAGTPLTVTPTPALAGTGTAHHQRSLAALRGWGRADDPSGRRSRSALRMLTASVDWPDRTRWRRQRVVRLERYRRLTDRGPELDVKLITVWPFNLTVAFVTLGRPWGPFSVRTFAVRLGRHEWTAALPVCVQFVGPVHGDGGRRVTGHDRQQGGSQDGDDCAICRGAQRSLERAQRAWSPQSPPFTISPSSRNRAQCRSELGAWSPSGHSAAARAGIGAPPLATGTAAGPARPRSRIRRAR